MPFLATVVAYLLAHTLQIGAITTGIVAVTSAENLAVTTIELKDKIEAK